MGSAAQVPQLRGREEEIRAIGAALDRVASGRQTVVLIDGEAGIGKSRLLHEALEAARVRGMQVVTGRAEELQRMRPFGVAADAFGCVRSSPDSRRAALAGLLAGGGPGEREPITVTSDQGLRFRTIDAFADLAEELALSGPLVIGIDDLQWADPSSLLTLGALGRRLAYLPAALVGCYRLSPRVAELDRLTSALEDAGALHLSLRPLAADAVTGLVAEILAAEPGPGLLARISGAAGNPLFVTELVEALVQEGAIEAIAGRAEAEELTLPPTLRLTILRRLSFLSEGTLQALRVASILGPGFSLADLATVTGRPAVDLALVLAEAIGARVLEDDGTVLRFRHDLIHEAIYADLPASMIQGLHREAGQRLARSGAPALQVAEQLARGAVQGDADAIGWLTRAAREGAARSPDVAADLLARAAALTDPADPGRDQLLAERVSSLMLAGRIADAEVACRLVLGRGQDRSVTGRVRIYLGQALLAQGRVGEALQELEQAGTSPALDGAQRAAAWAWAGYARLARGDLDGASAVAEQARSAAVSSGDHLSVSVAMHTLARVSEFRGHLRGALQVIDEAVRLADLSPGRLGHHYPVRVTRGHILTELDRPEADGSVFRTGRQLSEELGVRWHLPTYQVFLAYQRFFTGEWDDAIAEAETTFELAEEIGETHSRGYAHGVLSLISFHRNDLSRAREGAAAAARDLAGRNPGYPTMTLAAWPRALILEVSGGPREALVGLAGTWDRCDRLGLVLEYPAVGPDLVRLALAAADPARARAVSAAVAEVASRNEVPWMTGAALCCRGLIEDDAEILHEAARAYANGSRPHGLALACEEAGVAWIRHGHTDRACPLLDQAIGIYERLDAARDLARAEAALREAGIRRGRRISRGRPQIGWDSLTPAERMIAGLVAEGLSNPQIGQRLFISRRTVQTHLAHVFAKLDISARAQLAVEVSRHQNEQSSDVEPRLEGRF